nr:PQQ-binding-like beta-propeller repeat protein [Actinopolymorpha pittospori]
MRSFSRLAARSKGPAAVVAGLALLAVANWSPGWSRGTVIQAGSTYLVTSGLEVRAFAQDGKERWHRTFPDVEAGLEKGNGSVTVRESGGVVVATYSHPTDDHWPHPEVVEAVDPVTGHPLWKQTASPYIAVTDQTVFTPVCRGKQTGRSDDCRLSARDPRTGRARWTVDAEHVAQVVAASPRVVVLSTKPTGLGGKSWITTLDASTGRRLGVRVETAKFGGGLYPASAERIVKFNDLAGDTLVLGSTDQQGDKACTVDLEGRDPRSGSRRWKTTLRLAVPVEGASCRYGLPDGSGTTLFATTSDGRPQVFDLRQGRTLWRGPRAGTIVAGDERVVMVRDDQTARLTLYDLRTGRARWSIEGPAGARNDVTAALTGERLLLWESGYDGCASVPAGPHGCVDVFDLSDGTKTLTTDGAAAGYGAGWIAARARSDNGATFSLYDTA